MAFPPLIFGWGVTRPHQKSWVFFDVQSVWAMEQTPTPTLTLTLTLALALALALALTLTLTLRGEPKTTVTRQLQV